MVKENERCRKGAILLNEFGCSWKNITFAMIIKSTDDEHECISKLLVGSGTLPKP